MPRSKEPSKRRRDWAGTAGQAALMGGVMAMIGGGAWALPIGPTAQTSNGATTTYAGNIATGVSAVNLAAPRTIIDWRIFSIAPGETLTFNANARSDIVLNRVADFSQVQINGTLNSLVGTQTGGNVWFSSPGGVVFGPNAVVNVGGLLATTATLVDTADFLDPTKSSFNFQFEGSGTLDPSGSTPYPDVYPYYGGVVVQSGAKLSTSKGLLALVAPFVTVQSGAQVGDANTGDVLIGGASGYTITLGQETAGDLDLLEYQIPVSYAGADVQTGDTSVAPAVTIAGAVTGKNAYVTALSLQSLTNAIVTDSGSITATGAVQQGNGTVILTADTFDLVPASYPNGSVFDPTLGVAPTSGSNLFLPQYATPLSFGAISAPQTYLHGGGLVQQAANTMVAGGGAQISAGDISLTGVNLTGSFQATAEPLPAAQYTQNQATPPGGTVSGGPVTANDIAVRAAGNISIGAFSAAGGPLTLTSDNGVIQTGALNSGGALTVNAPNGGMETAAINAGGAVSLTAGGAAGFSIDGFVFTGDITSGGAVSANALNGGLSLGVVNAGGALTLTAGGALSASLSGHAQATSLTAGGALTVNASRIVAGAVTGQSVNLAAASGGTGISVGDVKATGGTLTLSAASGDVDATSLTATGAATAAATNGAVSIGTPIIDSITETQIGLTPGPVTGQSVALSGNTGVTAGAVTATGGPITLSAANGAIAMGALQATGDIDAGGASIATGAVSAGGMASLIATPGPSSSGGSASVTVNGVLSATQATVQAGDGLVAITSANIGAGGLAAHALGSTGDVWLGYASPGAGGGTGTLAGSASLYATRNVNVDVAGSASLSVVQAANQASLRSETGNLTLGTVTVGGLLTAAAPQGSISLAALDQAAQATLTAGTDIALGIQPASVTGSAVAGRDLTVAGADALDLTGFGLSAGRDAALSSPGQLTVAGFTAGRDLTLSGAGVQAGAGLSAGRNASLSATGLVSIAGLTAANAATVTAGDLALTGALTAPTVTIASLSGPLTLGGSGTGTGLVLDSAEFGRINASTALNLYAGAPSATARGDLAVQTLAIDPAKTPSLNLYAAAGHAVSIAGLAAPTANGGAVTVGGLAGWTPTAILVSGGLGAATRVSDTQFTGVRAFDQVTLNALGDVVMGSPRFIGLIQATAPDQINLALNRPAGAQAQGAEIGGVYLAAGRLAVTAGGKVVGQNTSGVAGGYAGVYLANTPGTPGLVLTLDPPSVVDLFGSYVNRTGAISSGPVAAVGPELKVLAATNPLNYRFNGCIIGVGCGGSALAGPAQGLQPLNGLQTVFVTEATDASDAAGAAESAEAASAPGARVQPPAFSPLPSADADAQADPVVTGTGNEEIWRKRGGSSQ